jgi:hypothetical protein
VTFNEIMREYEATKNGPGSYMPSFKLTEKRLDTGSVQIKDLVHQQTVDNLDLRPSLDPKPIKSNKLVFKYHEPSD